MDYNVSEAPGVMQWNSSGKKVGVLTGANEMREVAKFLCMRIWENFDFILEREEKNKKDRKGGRTKREAYVRVEVRKSGMWMKWPARKPYHWDNERGTF